jgi:hypothetical protein
MYPFKPMKTKELRVKTGSKGLRAPFRGIKVKGLHAAITACSPSFSFIERIAGSIYQLCHDFRMEIAFVYEGFSDLEGVWGLDTRIMGCF